MPESSKTPIAYIEVAFADLPRQTVAVQALPFNIGRGKENGNHLSLNDMRISRQCAAISSGPSGLLIEDRGQRDGIFVNNMPTKTRSLADGDRIRLGNDEGCQLIFRLQAGSGIYDNAETKLRGLLGNFGSDSADELKGLRLLLEASSLMHSELPLESVLAAMLDHAIEITHADRGMLLEPDESEVLQVIVARGRDAASLDPQAMNPSRSVLANAIETESAVINEDLRLADINVQSAQSVVHQLLRSSVVIPLYGTPREQSEDSAAPARKRLLGAVYLDSKRTATFSDLDRQILNALGAQAGSILENARLIEHERERQRLEQELGIAREIQQALVPQGLQNYPNFSVTGTHKPCYEVGGDYFDVCPLEDGRIAVMIADVAGKGLGAALLTTMLQGVLTGMALGVEPVKVFHHLNRFLSGRSSVVRYATIFFALLSPDGTLDYVCAGHPSPLLLRAGSVSKLYSGGSFPIGLIDVATFSSTRIQLEPGDTLLLYTDGVTEAENHAREQYQEDRLMQALARHQNSALKELQEDVLSDIEKFTAGASQFDDITLLSVRYLSNREEDAQTA